MYKRTYYIISLLILTMAFSSCEDVIDINYKLSEPSIVIEAIVTNNFATQYVKVSKSVNVSMPGVFPAVSGATIMITDNQGRNFVFKETTDPGVYSSVFRGRPSLTYTLNVNAEGKDYTAVSTMPSPVNLDSIKVIKNEFFGEESLSVQPWFNDPGGVKNYYRFAMTINEIPSKNIFAFSDEFNDGKIVSYELRDADIDLKSGDEIVLEMQGIDKNVYKYWDGLDQNRGGASATPANPVSNINNGALGYFSAQVTQRGSVKIN